jgi:hypothetical protein
VENLRIGDSDFEPPDWRGNCLCGFGGIDNGGSGATHDIDFTTIKLYTNNYKFHLQLIEPNKSKWVGKEDKREGDQLV